MYNKVMYFEILPAKIFKKSPLLEDGILTYTFSEDLPVGTIVEVPIGKVTTLGIVYKKVKKPEAPFKIKSILRSLYNAPLPDHLLKSIFWLSEYYLVPLPQVVSLFLPNNLKNRHQIAKVQNSISTTPNLNFSLNVAQKTAISELKNSKMNTKLLHGITGSGKTNIYLNFALETLNKGKSIILLVPEIALTSQLVSVFKSTFNQNIILIHSKQTAKTRRDTFEQLLLSDIPKIIIGPRSALLAPVKNLGLIIIDEATNLLSSKIKPQNTPHFVSLATSLKELIFFVYKALLPLKSKTITSQSLIIHSSLSPKKLKLLP